MSVIASDACMVLAALLATQFLVQHAAPPAAIDAAALLTRTGASRVWLPLLQFCALLLGFFLQDHYAIRGRRIGQGHFGREFSQVTSAAMLGGFAFGILNMAQAGTSRMPETLAMLPWFASVPLVMLGRAASRLLLRNRAPIVRTVLIGDAAASEAVACALESRRRAGYAVVETVAPARFVQRAEAEGAAAVLGAMQASFTVVVLGGADPPAERRAVQLLDRSRVHFAIAPNAQDFPTTGITAESFFGHDVMLLERGARPGRRLRTSAKASLDFAVAFALIVFLAPVLGAVWILTRRDGGPALFRHRRVGANGRPFDCLKFRTMVVGADQRLADLLARDHRAAAEWAATHKLKHDPRITPVGRFLRSTSLDELPQLFNVLRGEMSLVGPRPVVQSELPRYAENSAYYCDTLPGLTGLWQVSGRSDTSYQERVRLDVWYVRNWSFWHDLAILAKTIPAVVRRRGAS